MLDGSDVGHKAIARKLEPELGREPLAQRVHETGGRDHVPRADLEARDQLGLGVHRDEHVLIPDAQDASFLRPNPRLLLHDAGPDLVHLDAPAL
jgi:hypothetical protein